MSVYVTRHYQPNVRSLSREEEHWFNIVQKQRLRDVSHLWFIFIQVATSALRLGFILPTWQVGKGRSCYLQ